jgi:hypothetical protein
LPEKSRIDFTGKIGIRLRYENRSAIDPDRFFDRDRDRGCDSKIGIRFENGNRGSILRSKSLIAIFPERFLIASVIAILFLFQDLVEKLLWRYYSGYLKKWRQVLESYPEDIEEDEDTDTGDSPDGADKNRCKIVAQVRFSHPLHDVEEVKDYQEKKPDDRVYDDHRELFDQEVYNSNNSHDKENSNDD